MSSTAKQTKYIMSSTIALPGLLVEAHSLQESEAQRVLSTLSTKVNGVKTEMYLPIELGKEFSETTLTDFAVAENYSLEKHEGNVKTVLNEEA